MTKKTPVSQTSSSLPGRLKKIVNILRAPSTLKNKTENLFILAEARSGSSWLMHTLDSHKDITLLPELLNHVSYEEVASFRNSQPGNFPQCVAYLESMLEQIPHPQSRYRGCKILLNQLELISPNFSRYLLEFYKDSYFIFLYRENLVESQVSLRLAHSFGKWHYKKEEKIEKKTVRLVPKLLMDNLEKQKKLRQTVRSLIDELSIKVIDLSYEKLFQEKQKSLKQICEFLDIRYEKNIKYSKEKKGNPFLLQEVIENYDEISILLKAYPDYYEMLIQ